MRTLLQKFSRLGQISDEAVMRQKVLEAINLELQLPAMFGDMGGKVTPESVNGIKVFGKNHNISVPSEKAVLDHIAQKWAVPSDTPNLAGVAGQIVSYFHSNMPEMDIGWQQAYQLVDMRAEKQDHFEILDTNLGVTFTQVKAGAEVKIRRAVTENATVVKYLSYADGVGVLDDWLRFQKFWNIEQVTAEFVSQSYNRQATDHYGLFTALGAGINVAFDTDDTKTLNAATAAILRKVRPKGYGASINSNFIIYCAPEDVGRVLKTLTATSGSLLVAYNANAQPVQVHISAVIATTYIAAGTGSYYLVLPGRKLQRGVWRDLTTEQVRNIYVRGEDIVGTMQYNAAIGDQDQVARVAFA
jgi:hypothetical protein